MKNLNEDLLRILFPTWLFDYFEIERFEEQVERIDIYLGEKKIIPAIHHRVISHGFTDYSIVQDFPIKGKGVYLHLRRRKWLDLENETIFSNPFNMVYEGTRLTKEFVAFLKESNRK